MCSVEVKIICVQVEDIPESVRPGVSETLLRSLPAVCEKILAEANWGMKSGGIKPWLRKFRSIRD
jgi:Ni,Fe-hydrogenase maturation factor